MLKAWSLKFDLEVKFGKNFNNRFITIAKQVSCIAARDYMVFGNKYKRRIFGTSIRSPKIGRTYIWTSNAISQESPGEGTVFKNTREIILLSLGKSKYSFFCTVDRFSVNKWPGRGFQRGTWRGCLLPITKNLLKAFLKTKCLFFLLTK